MLKDGDVPRTAAVASGLAFWPDRTNEVSLALRFRGRLYDFWLRTLAKTLFFKGYLFSINSCFVGHSGRVALFGMDADNRERVSVSVR
jgi:hypothetical protein